MTDRGPDLALYLVADVDVLRSAGHDVVATVAAAARAGARTVQLRAKGQPARDVLDLTVALAEAMPPAAALLLNDRVDLALAARARGAQVAGVHLGQGDLPARDARDLLGPGAVVGVSASTADELAEARASGADYVGIGAFRATATKPDAPPPLGPDGLRALAPHCTLPWVAIGGITAGDAAAVRAAGAAGMAVVSGVCAAADPVRAVHDLRAAWEDAA